MISRSEAIKIIEEHVKNKNIIKHMFALEAVMGALWERIKKDGSKEEWMMAGLLHDGDYCEDVPADKQGIEIVSWVKEKGHDIPQNVIHAMAAHNWENTKVEPISSMDWSIYCADSLTGLIVACALVIPSKKLSDVSVEMILKKFKQPSFASGTRRSEIILCDEKLGINLTDFIEIALKAMQNIAPDLGL